VVFRTNVSCFVSCCNNSGISFKKLRKATDSRNYELIKKRVKIKESRNRPGVAQRVPGGLGSQIS
jgi:tRNA A58 N-methylase Trm61